MEKGYEVDKLFVAKPWVVDRDFSIDSTVIDKMVVESTRLKQLLTTSEINEKFPNADTISLHTVVLSQLPDSIVVTPTLYGYEDVLDGTMYNQYVSLSHCAEGDVYVLNDQHPGVKEGIHSILNLLSLDNEFLRNYLLDIKLKLTKQEIELFMKMYKEQEKKSKPKTMTLRNYIIYENGKGTFERF